MLRRQVDLKILFSIPFFQKKESILVLRAPADVTALAPPLHYYGKGQGSNRL